MKRSTLTFRNLVIIAAVAVIVATVAQHCTVQPTHAATTTCYIMAKESTHTWRYGTASSQTRQEVRRTIQRGRPFGYRQVRGNCTPQVRIN